MARLKFGAFLAPHHPIGEHPMLQFRRDLAFVDQLEMPDAGVVMVAQRGAGAVRPVAPRGLARRARQQAAIRHQQQAF